MVRILVLILAALALLVSSDRDNPGEFCKGDYIKFLDCVRKYAEEKTRNTYNECMTQVAPDGNEKKFYKDACNGENVGRIFQRCIYEKQRAYGTIIYPKQCNKKLNRKNYQDGHYIQFYFCNNPGRYACVRKMAPYEDLKYLDKCREKLFPELAEKEFEKFMCTFNDTMNFKRLGDLKTCFLNHLREVGRMDPPRYLTDCQFMEKAKSIQTWICAKENRLSCFTNSLPHNITTEIQACLPEFFPGANPENPRGTFCLEDDDTVQKVGKWTSCIIHTLHTKMKGSVRVYISKCV